MAINKNDAAARHIWGTAYDAIPKSVFAVAAWHLANVASGAADEPEAAEARMVEEIKALVNAEIINAAQGARAIKAITAMVLDAARGK